MKSSLHNSHLRHVIKHFRGIVIILVMNSVLFVTCPINDLCVFDTENNGRVDELIVQLKGNLSTCFESKVYSRKFINLIQESCEAK